MAVNGSPTITSLHQYPAVEIVEEAMREGMQIESVNISLADKIRLLEALSDTGLKTIVVGSFVSPKWVPQMACIDDLVSGFCARPGVTYTALTLNAAGEARLASHVPPLTPRRGAGRTLVHMCDVFAMRNTNRSQSDEIAAIGAVVAGAAGRGEWEASIALNAAWGSNWLGPFSLEERMELLEFQHRAWSDAGITVTRIWLGDPMAWNVPSHVAEQLAAVIDRWPSITEFHLHLHDARGSALTSAYAALTTLDQRHRLILDSSIGGMGGCPYCGHGRLTRMIPTEDLVDMLEELGIPTGVDLERLIEAAVLAEQIVGHELWGRVSKAGPRPRGNRLYPMDMPFIETAEQAQHFRLGADVYADAPSPWATPIHSFVRDAIDHAGSSR